MSSYQVAPFLNDFNKGVKDMLTWINLYEKSPKNEIKVNAKKNMEKLVKNTLSENHKGVALYLAQGFTIPTDVSSNAIMEMANFLSNLESYTKPNYQLLYPIIFSLYKEELLNVVYEGQSKESSGATVSSVNPSEYAVEYFLKKIQLMQPSDDNTGDDFN